MSKKWLVLEGDWGGQIYLTIPPELVSLYLSRYPLAAVSLLLQEIDRFAWGCNDDDGASAYILEPDAEDLEFGGIAGGMGGGRLTGSLWLHDGLKQDSEWEELAKLRLGLKEIK